MADENFEDDIFDDLYDEEPAAQSSAPAAAAPAPQAEPEPTQAEPASAPPAETAQNDAHDAAPSWQNQPAANQDQIMDSSGYKGGGNNNNNQSYDNAPVEDDNYGPINVKEDG